MKGAFLILTGGILFTGVFLGGAICGGLLAYEAEKAEKEMIKKPIQYRDLRYTGGSNIPEADK